jgi:hypothetical protein
MEIHHAMKLLDINTYIFTQNDLKKAYFKQAIKCHPDKNPTSVNSTKKFQDVKEAYDILLSFAVRSEDPSEYTSTDTSEYTFNIPSTDIDTIIQLGKCIINNHVVQFNNMGKLFDILITLYTQPDGLKKTSTDISTHTITANIYTWLSNYTKTYTGPYLSIYETLLEKLKEILPDNKYPYNIGHCSIISREFSPTIDDLLNDNIYKMIIDTKTFLVPCWYPESTFDISTTKSLVVTCVPILDDHVCLDETCNVHVTVSIPLADITISNPLFISVGKKKYTICTHQLTITGKQQTLCLNNSGILLITDDDFYKATARSNIYIHITLI